MENIQYERLAQRDVGAIPLSIGTSLAIESACGVLPEHEVTPAPLINYKELWVNLRTLFRNLYGALDKDFRDVVVPEVLVHAMMEELSILESAVIKGGIGNTQVVYYYCSYRSLQRKFPRAQKKSPSTPRQQAYEALEYQTLKALFEANPSHDIRHFDVDLEGQHPAAMIITHCPVDLLSKPFFASLVLLESHTGALKPHTQWNTKLTNGRELTRIPFNRMTLQVFGDGGVFFSPMPIKLRRYVVELAEQYNWTSVTTKDKIVANVRKLDDPSAIVFLLDLF